VLENQPGLPAVEYTHGRSGRASTLSRASGVEDLKPTLHFVQGKVAVAEDDSVGRREASVQARQPAFGSAAVMSYRDGSPANLDLQLGRQRAPQRLLIDIAMHGMDDRAERLYLLQRRGGEEVAGMDDRLRRRNQLDATLGQPTGSLGHMRVGKDDIKRGRF
jgi:hypothetical protein